MRKLLYVLVSTCIFCFYGIPAVCLAENTSTTVTYGDTIQLYFDEREWKLGANNRKDNIFYEYVTDGQNVLNWNELVTLQMFKGLPKKATVEQYAKTLANALYKSCGDKLTLSVIHNKPDDYMFEWKVNDHPKLSNQHEIDRFIKGKETLVIIHYVMKTSELTADKRDKWIEILNKASLTSGADNAAKSTVNLNGIYREVTSLGKGLYLYSYYRFFQNGTVSYYSSVSKEREADVFKRLEIAPAGSGEYSYQNGQLVFTLKNPKGTVDYWGTVEDGSLSLSFHSNIINTYGRCEFKFIEVPELQ